MGLFSNSTPFDEQLDKATNEVNTETDWGLILSLCDKIKTTPKGASDFASIILPKINHKVPHVSMQAITVLDACINNCDKDFKKVVASSNFTEGLREILYHYKNPTVTRRLRYFIRKWAEEFKEDTQLSHFVSFYYDLRGDGLDFPEAEDDSPSQKRKTEISTDPDVVSSQQEADDIAKAIEASLKEEQQRKSNTVSSFTATSNLYPSVLGGSTSTSPMYSGASYTSSGQQMNRRKVKALYDFEAAEDNELTFKTGDMITILDDSDANWWKGEGANGSGLFPSNFVTSDLTEDVEEEAPQESRETVVKFSETLEVKEVDQDQPVLEIDEDLIDRTLAALQSTDPENTTTDPEDLLRSEETCLQMGKLIDSQLEDIDRKHLELTILNGKILESLQMYDKLMKKMPTFPSQHYAMASTLPHGMMPVYQGALPYGAASYIPQGQPGPSAGVPQPGTITSMTQSQAFNPMYQAPPPGSYVVPVSNGIGQQPPAPTTMLTNPAYQTNLPQQLTIASGSFTPVQPNQALQGNSPPQVMQQFQSTAQSSASGMSAYPANQVTSQPLM